MAKSPLESARGRDFRHGLILYHNQTSKPFTPKNRPTRTNAATVYVAAFFAVSDDPAAAEQLARDRGRAVAEDSESPVDPAMAALVLLAAGVPVERPSPRSRSNGHAQRGRRRDGRHGHALAWGYPGRLLDHCGGVHGASVGGSSGKGSSGVAGVGVSSGRVLATSTWRGSLSM